MMKNVVLVALVALSLQGCSSKQTDGHHRHGPNGPLASRPNENSKPNGKSKPPHRPHQRPTPNIAAPSVRFAARLSLRADGWVPTITDVTSNGAPGVQVSYSIDFQSFMQKMAQDAACDFRDQFHKHFLRACDHLKTDDVQIEFYPVDFKSQTESKIKYRIYQKSSVLTILN